MSVQLGVDLKRTFERWCEDRSLVPGKVVRGLVQQAVDGAESPPRKPPAKHLRTTAVPLEDEGPKVGREIQLTPSEDAALVAAAAAEGYSVQAFVVAAVRAALAQTPTFGQPQIEALSAGNRALHQLLVEVAELRRGAGGPAPTDLVDRWTELEVQVRRHVETVAMRMAEGAQRWSLRSSS